MSTASAVYRILDAVISDFVRMGSVIEQIDRAASGLSEAMSSARREMYELIDSEPRLRPYFLHLENNATGIARLASAQHGERDAVLASHENNVATRQNQDMRTISAYAALLAIPTVIAGIYGMNFKDLPLLKLELGWLIVVSAMIVLDVLAYVIFRHRGWLGGAPSTRSDGERSDQT